MSSLALLRSLFAHMTWADEKVRTALAAEPSPPPAAVEQFAHLLAAEHVWFVRITGSAPKVPVWPALTLDQCAELAADNARGFEALLTGERDETLTREVAYTNSAGQHFVSRAVDILTHVAMHGSYHRGMISLLMRQGGGTPAPTDFIAFVRGAAAATRRV